MLAIAPASVAQVPDTVPAGPTVADAIRFRNDRDFEGAIVLLRAVTSQAPDDSTAARLLGETLYWVRRDAEARTTYEAALLRHPDDDSLRLAYGRMLVETLRARDARRVLTPSLGRTNGQAELLLGTSAYWSGDYATARGMFISALRGDSTLASARLQLYEIVAVTAPMVRFGTNYAKDNQPLQRVDVSVAGEYFVLPNLRVWFRIQPVQFSPSARHSVLLSQGGESFYLPKSQVEIDFSLGSSSPADIKPWNPGIVALSIRKRFERHLVARISAQRDRYLNTVASLDTMVFTRTGRALLALNDPYGRTGEAALQHQLFDDDNAITSAYVWFLAPIRKLPIGDLQAGYAAAVQNATESRFALARPDQQFPATDLNGRYSPYYTPDHSMTHSLLLAATTNIRSGVTLRTNASVGVYATENAFMFVNRNNPPPGQPPTRRERYRRSFTPLSGRAAINVVRPNDWMIAVTGEYQRTGFYSVGTIGVQLTRRFTAAAVRRADRY